MGDRHIRPDASFMGVVRWCRQVVRSSRSANNDDRSARYGAGPRSGHAKIDAAGTITVCASVGASLPGEKACRCVCVQPGVGINR